MMESDLAEFLTDSFASVWALELLLCLHREPHRVWTADELVAELRSSRVIAEQGIRGLLTAGLIVADSPDTVQYRPASAAQDALVERLAEAYRTKPAAVRRLIIKGKSETLRSFSDAFKFGRD